MVEPKALAAALITGTKSSNQGLLRDLQGAIEEAFAAPVRRSEFGLLAGPNNLIQFLPTLSTWAALGLSALVFLGMESFMRQFGKRGADAAADRLFKLGTKAGGGLDPAATERLINRLVDNVIEAHRVQSSFVAGLPDTGLERNIGVELPLFDPENRSEARQKVALLLVMFGASAQEIATFLEERPSLKLEGIERQNSDLSVRIRATARGALKLRFLGEGGEPLDAVFDLDGFRIESAPPSTDIESGTGKPINLKEPEL